MYKANWFAKQGHLTYFELYSSGKNDTNKYSVVLSYSSVIAVLSNIYP